MYKYEHTIYRNLTFKNATGGAARRKRYTGKAKYEKELESRQRSNIRAYNKVKRLAIENFSKKSKFVTLTFKENVTDLAKANKEFQKFIRKLKYRHKDLKYLAVIEFQQRGAVHYHMLIDNVTYLKQNDLSKMWPVGSYNVSRVDRVVCIGSYLVKYMTMENADPRLNGKKMYTASRNLRQPIEYIGNEAELLFKQLQYHNAKPSYQSSFIHQNGDKVYYYEYDLSKLA